MLQKAYFLAKIGAHTAANEQHSAEILPIAEQPRGERERPVPEAARAVQRRAAVARAPSSFPFFPPFFLLF